MASIKAQYGTTPDGKSAFHVKAGTTGGRNGHTGGFYANRELARTAGALGGRKSRRTKSYNKEAVCNNNSQMSETAVSASTSSTKTFPCASCHKEVALSELDDMGLCSECPKTPKKHRLSISKLWKPF